MENSLANKKPWLVAEWSERNGSISPDDVPYGSKKLYWWHGSCGHEWQASAKARSSGENCPICSNARIVAGINDLASLKPELLKEWSPSNTIQPTEIGVGSHKNVLPMLSENKKRMVVAICAEEEISSIEWARLKKDKWVNRSISCPEYVQSIYKMMNWNKDCRYKVYGRLANSERGLVLVFDLASAVMFDPLPEEYFDKHTGKMKKRIVKYYPDEIRMKLGRSYSDYEALQQRSSFESLSGYMDTSGGAVPATVSEELAASISMQEQEKKRETLFGTIIGNGGDDDVRNNE